MYDFSGQRVRPRLPKTAAIAQRRTCAVCHTTETPRWRCDGTLCNACGFRVEQEAWEQVRFEEELQKQQQARHQAQQQQARPQAQQQHSNRERPF